MRGLAFAYLLLSSCLSQGWQCDETITSPPQPVGCASTPTVAYSFIMRDQFNSWEMWKRYFHTCPPGSVLIVVHTQAAAWSRATLQAQIDEFGGHMVSAEDVRATAGPHYTSLSRSEALTHCL